MNTSVELHDSRVTDVVREGSGLRVVHRPAYVHRSEGRPGTDAGWGFLQVVQFRFQEAMHSAMGECLGDVANCTIAVGGAEYLNLVPMPLHSTGSVKACIELASWGILTVSADGFSCSATGDPDPNFKERYDG